MVARLASVRRIAARGREIMAGGRIKASECAPLASLEVESEDEIDDARVVWEQEDLVSQWTSGKLVVKQHEIRMQPTPNAHEANENGTREHDLWNTVERSPFSRAERLFASPEGTSKEYGQTVQVQPDRHTNDALHEHLAAQQEECLRERKTNVPVERTPTHEFSPPTKSGARCLPAPKGSKTNRRRDYSRSATKRKRFSIVSPTKTFDARERQESQGVDVLWKAMDMGDAPNAQHHTGHPSCKSADEPVEERSILDRKSSEFSSFLESLEPQAMDNPHNMYLGSRKSRKALRPGLSSRLVRILSSPGRCPLNRNRTSCNSESCSDPCYHEVSVTTQHFQAHLVIHLGTLASQAATAKCQVILIGNTKQGDRPCAIGTRVRILSSQYEEAMEVRGVKCLIQHSCIVNNIHGIQNNNST